MSLQIHRPSLAELQEVAKIGAKQYSAVSTSEEYKRIVDEYEEYCLALHGTAMHTHDLIFLYLTYCAHRPTRPNGVWRDAGEPGDRLTKKVKERIKFDKADYEKVMSAIPRPKQMVKRKDCSPDKLDNIRKHYNALLEVCPDSVKADLANSSHIKNLKKQVLGRQKYFEKISFAEKVNPQVEKFKYAEIAKQLENYFWGMHSKKKNLGHITASFRNRYHLNSTVQTCVRHESCLKCKLSNFSLVEWHIAGEVDPYYVLFRQIDVAKNCKAEMGKRTKIQAKSIRHKDPQRCEQGSLAFFLYLRFLLLNENIDFCENGRWFNIRTAISTSNKDVADALQSRANVDADMDDTSAAALLENVSDVGYVQDVEDVQVDNTDDQAPFEADADNSVNPDDEKEMGKSTFYSIMRKAMKAIKCVCSHVRHFGRCAGPAILELMEVDRDLIRQLGNWLQGVYDRHYSCKIGWEALRVAAGFEREKGMYYVPRSRVKPPQELKDMVFPNVSKARDAFHMMPDDFQMKRTTAQEFIRVMDYLAEVFLQDACVFIDDPVRGQHNIFELPIFNEPLFQSFLLKFRRDMIGLTHPSNDPTIDRVKKAAPVIGNHLAGIRQELAHQTKYIHQWREESRTMLSEHHEATIWNQSILSQQNQEILRNLQHFGFVGEAAAMAHIHSPYRRKRTCENDRIGNAGGRNVRQRLDYSSVSHAAFTCNTVESPASPHTNFIAQSATPRNDDIETTNEAEFANVSPTETDFEAPTVPLLSTKFDTFSDMYKTWTGEGGSTYEIFGGYRSLWDKSAFRERLSESRKKSARRLQYFANYVDWNVRNGMTEEEVFTLLHDTFKTTNKKEITLSGAEVVLKKRLNWNGKEVVN